MADDLESTVRNAASKLAQQLENTATLTVETRWVEVAEGAARDWEEANLVSWTNIRLDQDTQVIIPMRRNEAGALERDVELFDLHMQNVTAAIEYRARMLEAVMKIAQQVRSR